MLILNNGVPKSGSPWVQKILQDALNPAYPSTEWRNHWENPSIAPDNLKSYITSADWHGAQPVLIKTHIVCPRSFDFLFHSDIRIVVSYRSLPETVVSAFHHQVRLGKVQADRQNKYFRTMGRRFAIRAVTQRLSWARQPGVCMLRYEDLLADTPGQIHALLAWLKHPVSAARAEALAAATRVRLSACEAPRDGAHIRTGGRSTAQAELPAALFDELTELEASLPEIERLDTGCCPITGTMERSNSS